VISRFGRYAVPVLAAACTFFCAGHAAAAECARPDGAAFRDVHWRHEQPAHPLAGQVLKGEAPIPIAADACRRTPLQQLIADVWATIRAGGFVLLGEVHDNPEHHRVRGDILWPRLDSLARPDAGKTAAVFEHIRPDQRPALETFYRKAARSRRLWRAPDLLRLLDWSNTGWPDAAMFYPLFDAALWAKMPILPGNAVRAEVRALARSGVAALPAEERVAAQAADALPKPLADALLAELEASHCGAMPAAAFAGMGLAQRYTDAVLARSLKDAAGEKGSAFLMAGNGHVRTDRGVPWHLRRLAPGRDVVAVMLLEVEDGKDDPKSYVPRDPSGDPAADYILFTPRQARPDPCEQFRRGTEPKR
jgi:uncharacterized iron-regulated protein